MNKSSIKIINIIKYKIRSNPFFYLIATTTTLFFLIQHYFDFSWDFAAYLINAKYLFYGGNYVEVYRAPLISLILGPLLIFGSLAPYLYVAIVSILFFYSTKSLSDSLFEKYFYKYKVKKQTLLIIFTIFILNSFLLIFGLVVGTELLALSFFQLFLSYFIRNKSSGHFLALAFLSRYNFFIFIPFLFFNKSIKKIIQNLFLFFIVTLPWFIYNKIKWGNYFTSIADSFYLNVFSRLDRVEAFNITSLLAVINWLLPLFILGLLVPVIVIIRKREINIKEFKYELLFLAIFLFFLYDVYTIPFKVIRYMFNMVLPIAFFSTIGFLFLLKNIENKKGRIALYLFLTFLAVSSFVIAINLSYRIDDSDTMYFEAYKGIKEQGLIDCQILSPHWVPVNYYSGNVRFLPYSIEEGLKNKEILLIFTDYPTMDDKFTKEDIKEEDIISQGKSHVILADKSVTNKTCIKSQGYSNPMTSNACEALSMKFKSEFMKDLFIRTCRFINYLK